MIRKELLREITDTDWDNIFLLDAIWQNDNELAPRRLKGAIKGVIKSLFLTGPYMRKVHGNPRILFVYPYNKRKDHLQAFVNLTSQIDDAELLLPGPTRFRPRGFIDIWFIVRYMRRRKFPLKKAIDLARNQAAVLSFLDEIVKLDIQKYKMIVVYYDLASIGRFIVEFAQKRKIPSATLQHGAFVSANEKLDGLDKYGIELSYCAADYLLAWNQFSKEEAVKAGMAPERVVVLGPPKYAGLHIAPPPSEPKGIFGVILGWDEARRQNVELVKIANEAAQKSGLKYIIRCHPGSNSAEYTNIANEFCVGVCPAAQSIIEYMDTVDFSICGGTSMFVELLLLGRPVYRLRSEKDKYYRIDVAAFSTADDLLEQVQNKSVDVDKEKLKRYVCEPNEILGNYQKFFKTVGEER